MRPTTQSGYVTHEMQITVLIRAEKSAYYRATRESPEEGGELDALKATYNGQTFELSDEDEAEALLLLSDAEVITAEDFEELGRTGT